MVAPTSNRRLGQGAWVCHSRRKRVKVTIPSIILHKTNGYTKNAIQRGTCPIIHRLAVAWWQ